MAAAPLLLRLLVVSLFALQIPRLWAAERSADLCPKIDRPFVDEIGLQCPRWIDRSSPQQVTGEKIDWEITLHGRDYHSVLFYASLCPFSTNTFPIFHALSSMFPQIKHVTVEESSIMPSALSRYGIHSFPAIFLANQTATVRYHGPKSVDSLVQFYMKTTGFSPITDVITEQERNSEKNSSLRLQFRSWLELVKDEPYVVLGFLFILLKLLVQLIPVLYFHAKVLWVSLAWHMNLEIPPGSRQLLQRLLHLFDIKRIWSKLELCNRARDFRKGANNARVWASSSLASVSLGDASSSRPFHSE